MASSTLPYLIKINNPFVSDCISTSQHKPPHYTLLQNFRFTKQGRRSPCMRILKVKRSSQFKHHYLFTKMIHCSNFSPLTSKVIYGSPASSKEILNLPLTIFQMTEM